VRGVPNLLNNAGGLGGLPQLGGGMQNSLGQLKVRSSLSWTSF
jgi:hypothetical protein